jgi:hypothetical protein
MTARRNVSGVRVLLLALCLAGLLPQAARAQQIYGVWQTRVQGLTFPMIVTITLGSNGRFQQNINGGPSVCLQQMTVGEYGPLSPGLYRFVVRDYEPKRDCTGNAIRSMPGWTAALQLASPTMLLWRDQLSGRTLQFVRLQ